MSKIRPCLWFENNMEEAIAFYQTVFSDMTVESINRMPDGNVITGNFTIEGQEFMGLNAGPMFKFTEAVSFYVSCEDQAEVDRYWDALTANGGEESQCGWLKDKFGLSWQIVPKQFEEMMGGEDPAKVQAMIDEMFKMQKLEVAKLRAAYDAA